MRLRLVYLKHLAQPWSARLDIAAKHTFTVRYRNATSYQREMKGIQIELRARYAALTTQLTELGYLERTDERPPSPAFVIDVRDMREFAIEPLPFVEDLLNSR